MPGSLRQGLLAVAVALSVEAFLGQTLMTTHLGAWYAASAISLIRRVYEVDPLVCPRCGAEMRVIGFITETSLVKRILDHIRRRDRVSRPPPQPQPAVAHIA